MYVFIVGKLWVRLGKSRLTRTKIRPQPGVGDPGVRPYSIWRERAGPGLHHAILEHPGAPHPPFTFYMQFCMGGATPGATPEKRVLAAPGDTDNRHRLPTHAAGGPQVSPGASLPGGVAIRGAYPRRRRAPCLGGSCRRVETLPYKPVCGVRLIQTRHKISSGT